ncbi:hypothetical protein HPA15_07410 [Streptococcus suis]|nr:hypothetical protein [Streptococcus suis]
MYHVQDASVAGFSIGIITIDFNYVKLPGNVANATTFSFPVVYEDIVLEIEDLFNGEEKLLDMVIEAAKKLEKKGVRAKHPEIAAILLECSDLPPYAAALHRETGLPVFDFTTLINWVHSAVVRKKFYGYM